MGGYIQDLRKIVGHRTLIQCAASIICINKQGHILLGKRTDNHQWGYAGGSVEIDEKVEDAARREFFEETGNRISEHNEEQMAKSSPFDYRYYVLYTDREKLYERINSRVDEMMADGLEEEVRTLVCSEGLTEDCSSMKGIGYREFFPYFRGECTLDETVEKIKQDTRHFAKRQLTWFRREKDVVWLDKGKLSDEEILDIIMRDAASLKET